MARGKAGIIADLCRTLEHSKPKSKTRIMDGANIRGNFKAYAPILNTFLNNGFVKNAGVQHQGYPQYLLAKKGYEFLKHWKIIEELTTGL